MCVCVCVCVCVCAGNGPSQTAEVPVVSVEIFGDRVFEDPAKPAEKIWAYSKWDRQLCGKVRVECSKDTLVLKGESAS